ncbi:GNAT family N-acetyltransferase [Labrenzia sp. PHM005]|uniref:GNAT family N-acetyltransferase n=1 Tax=Labrenzia sp. PHM005 TaxID=2590016 RepID=UPI00143DF44E|nr:GNAT family N-acetyltransferase [Labrenzia sp. PHM005]
MSAGFSLAEKPSEVSVRSDDISVDVQNQHPVTTTAIDLQLVTGFDQAAEDWQQLYETGYATPYQSRTWCQAYLETLGRENDNQPLIAVARQAGQPVLLLPLLLKKKAGFCFLSFLGAGIGNQNTGLWDRAFYDTVQSGTIQDLLDRICRAAKADCLALQNVPVSWHGQKHPLCLDNAQPSPSPVFRGNVDSDFQTLFADTHSKSARKNLTRKRRHLQDAGDYEFGRCSQKEEIEAGLVAFLSQREARARITGIPNAFSDKTAQAFLRHAVGLERHVAGTNPPLQIWTLKVSGKIRATYLCGRHQDTLYAYSNSVAHDELLKNSPGLVLIREIIEEICADPDTTVLDLGVGEEKYKTGWTSPEALCDGLLPITVKGQIFSKALSAKTRLKSAIRNSDRLWPLVKKLRQWRAPDK